MKLEEKLMKLRKENAWSQEEFAEKLNVSRQTISKWELGQTIPDTNNLTKIASIFGVSVNDLLDENENPIENNSKTNNKNSNTFKIVLLVAILLAVLGGIGLITLNMFFNRATKMMNEAPKSIGQMFGEYSISDILNIIFGKIEKSEKEFDKNSFNNMLKNLYYGNANGFKMEGFFDMILKSNEEHTDKLITVKYKDFESNNNNEIRALKKQMKTGADDNYEIYYEYDADGYINKAIIEDGEKEDLTSQLDGLLNGATQAQISKFDVDSFNQKFKVHYYGSTNGFFINYFIDDVIKSNEENPEHIITVNYRGTETSDADELRAMKKKYSNGTTYEIIYEYDENGLINKAIVQE